MNYYLQNVCADSNHNAAAEQRTANAFRKCRRKWKKEISERRRIKDDAMFAIIRS